MGYFDYSPLLKKLEESGLSPYSLTTHFGISKRTLGKFNNENPGFSTHTIELLCEILECQPGDLILYVPDENDAKTIEKKKEVIQNRKHWPQDESSHGKKRDSLC